MPRKKFRPARYRFVDVIGLVVALSAVGPAHAAQLTTNLSDRKQSIDGFGTAMGWWMDTVTGTQRSIYNNDMFERLYFDDLGASMMRVDMQVTVLNDARTISPSNAQMSTPIFLGADTYANIAKFNFEANGVGHVKDLVQAVPNSLRDDFKLIGTVWSPPHWMKGPELDWETGNVVNGSKPSWGQTANTQGGSLIDTPQNLQQYGRYITAWLKGWERASGTAFDAVSIQNELVFSMFFNSAVYTPELYVKALNAVDDAITAHNTAYPDDPILTRIHGPEDVGPGNLGINWRQFKFIDAVRNDPQANAALDIWSAHGVDGAGINFEDPDATFGRTNWEHWNAGRENPPDNFWAQWEGVGPESGETRPTWQTERSGERDAWLTGNRTSEFGGLALGARMHDALTFGGVSAYLFWQTMLNADRGDDGETLTFNNDPDRPKFAAFRHFSKHIRPEAVRIEVDSDDPQTLASAYLHEDDGTLTYVLLNLDDASEAVSLALPAGFEAETFEAWLSQDGSYYQPFALNLSRDEFSFTLPRESMMTIVLAAQLAALAGDYNANGVVEQGDLDLVLTNWGRTGTPNGWIGGGLNGAVDQGELDAILLNWGGTAAPSFAGFENVPEPALVARLLSFVVFAVRRRAAQA